jgi:hypothetical protein
MYDPNATAVEQNLLFGLLALQADLISRDNFVEACEEWSAGQELSFPRLLVQRGWLKAEDRREVERLVERKLARHGGDVRACLAELANNPLQGAFVSLQNRDVQLPLGMTAGQLANNSADGAAKVRHRDWGDHEVAHEVGTSADSDEDLGASRQRVRTFPRWLASAAVIVVAILGAVALGRVMMPLAQQQIQGGGIFPRGFQQGPGDTEPVADADILLVQGLFDALGNYGRVVDHILRDPMLTEAQRERALRAAKRGPQIPATYPVSFRANNASWYIVRQSDETEEAYHRALKLAEAAVILDPNPRDGTILNTLGVAQYRVGKFAEALKTLTESDRRNSADNGFARGRRPGSIPADLAFLAMASFRLGEKEKALAYLERLREAVPNERRDRIGESEAFLREAEQLIEGKAPPKPKTRPKEKPKSSKDEFTA